MQRVMTDVYLAEAMIGIDYNAYKSDSMKQALYESVFRKHGITQALYDSSMVWYGKNMDIFMGVYERMIKDIDKIIVTDQFIEFENVQPEIIKKHNNDQKQVC